MFYVSSILCFDSRRRCKVLWIPTLGVNTAWGRIIQTVQTLRLPSLQICVSLEPPVVQQWWTSMHPATTFAADLTDAWSWARSLWLPVTCPGDRMSTQHSDLHDWTSHTSPALNSVWTEAFKWRVVALNNCGILNIVGQRAAVQESATWHRFGATVMSKIGEVYFWLFEHPIFKNEIRKKKGQDECWRILPHLKHRFQLSSARHYQLKMVAFRVRFSLFRRLERSPCFHLGGNSELALAKPLPICCNGKIFPTRSLLSFLFYEIKENGICGTDLPPRWWMRASAKWLLFSLACSKKTPNFIVVSACTITIRIRAWDWPFQCTAPSSPEYYLPISVWEYKQLQCKKSRHALRLIPDQQWGL